MATHARTSQSAYDRFQENRRSLNHYYRLFRVDPLRLPMNQDRKSPPNPARNAHGYKIFENLGPFRTDRSPDLTVRGSLMLINGDSGDYAFFDVLVSTLVIPVSSTKIAKDLSSSGAP